MNNATRKSIALLPLLALLAATSASATVFEFSFTGQYTLLDSSGNYMDQKGISSTLTYDDSTGAGFSAGMTIAEFDTFGNTATIHSITLQHLEGTNFVIGNMFGDWGGNDNVPISMVWDATGLFNAIDYGLQVGDTISGTNLIRGGSVIYDVNSALPASDGTYNPTTSLYLSQGPAPLAVTTWNTTADGTGLGIDDGIAGSPMLTNPFPGLNVNFDIGSGNSLHVTAVSAVPIPAAAWLFGSGLLGLIGVARRNKAA